MSAHAHDVIVLGCGAVGSNAAYQLARRGKRVLGIEQFGPAHDCGSSHGQTRIIRQAYFEHPDYVPLVLRAYELWDELSRHSGETLQRQVGLLQIGSDVGEVIPGVLRSADIHGLEVERLSANAVEQRFSGFRVGEGMTAVFEPRAGLLHVERCVSEALQAADDYGAELHFHEVVRSWRAAPSHVAVETDRGSYRAEHLVITAGPWASRVLGYLSLPLTVRRKVQLWYRPSSDAYRADSGCPTFLYEMPEGIFYGFPQLDDAGMKIAEHTGGAVVADPGAVDRTVTADDRRGVEAFVEACLPGVSNDLIQSSVCMYTMTPSGNFIVDMHPHLPCVSLAAGLSGHGFKFAPVLGEALADLAIDGKTSLPIEFLGLARHREASGH